MDQGWTNNNANVTPGSYPMKFWHLFGMVAPIVHITQQNSLIDTFAKIRHFSFVETFLLISHPISTFSQQDFNHTHPYPSSISYFACESLGLCYESYTTMEEIPAKPDTCHVMRCVLSVEWTILLKLEWQDHTIRTFLSVDIFRNMIFHK